MSPQDAVAAAAARQILGFHAFLEQWLSGAAACSDALVRQALEGFAEGFLCIGPDGQRQSRDDLGLWLKAAWGSAPDLRIAISGIETLWRSGDAALVAYEERQVGASPNARRAVALFQSRGGRTRWVHVSEAWTSW